MSYLTIGALLKTASTKLAVCSDSAKLDAKILLAYVLDKEITYLFTWSDNILTDEQVIHLNSLLQDDYKVNQSLTLSV